MPGVIHRLLHGATDPLRLIVQAWIEDAALRRAVGDYRRSLSARRPLIDGRDLLRAGVAPGPAVARGLLAAAIADLNGRAPTAELQLAAALTAAGRA